jgi:hypothetical protein
MRQNSKFETVLLFSIVFIEKLRGMVESKARMFSPQTLKDHRALDLRKEVCTTMLPDVMRVMSFYWGESPQVKDMRVVAREICRLTGLTLDRLARRDGKALECWFCEYWARIEGSLLNLVHQQRGGYHTQVAKVPLPNDIKAPIPITARPPIPVGVQVPGPTGGDDLPTWMEVDAWGSPLPSDWTMDENFVWCLSPFA